MARILGQNDFIISIANLVIWAQLEFCALEHGGSQDIRVYTSEAQRRDTQLGTHRFCSCSGAQLQQ